MSKRTRSLRGRLFRAVNGALVKFSPTAAGDRSQRTFASWERLEERILFGYTPIYNQTPVPTTPCNGPQCQCPLPITGGNGNGSGKGAGGGGSGMGGSGSGMGGGAGAGAGAGSSAGAAGAAAGGSGAGAGTGGGGGGHLISETIGPAATTEAPITAFDGMPKIQSSDLQSTNFGLTWGVDRAWVGLDDTGPVGNGWAIAEAPYLVVNEPASFYAGKVIPGSAQPDDSVSLVEGGATFNFTIPEVANNSTQYAQLTSTDGYPYTLTQGTDGGTAVLKFSDGQGDTAEFYDVPRDTNNRPQPFSFGTMNLYGKFYKYAAANGTTITANYNAQDQLTGEVIANPATAAAAQYLFNYSTVSNTLGGSASLVSSIIYQEAPHGADWSTIRSASYVYYNGTGLDSVSPTPRSVNTNDGRLGDLESVTIVDGSGNVINSDYYRYYKLTGEQDTSSSNPASATNVETTTGGPSPLQPDNSSRNPYPDNYVFSGLKTAVQGASVDRLTAAVPGYLTAGDVSIQPYVNNFFTYERWDDHGGMDGWNYYGAAGYNSGSSSVNEQWNLSYMLGTRYRATEEIAQGLGCSSCSAGEGTYKYEYAQNYGSAGMGYNTLDYNTWRMKTTEFLPDDTTSNFADNNLEVIYSNEVGQPMLDVQVQVGTQTAPLTGMSVGSQTSNGYSITVNANNSFSTGQYVNILGVLPEMYDGVFKVTSATSTSFTFTLPQTYIGASGTAAPTPYVNTTTPSPGAVTLGAGSATLVISQQATGFRYDDSGHLIQTINPSAITGYDDSTADLFDSGSTYLGLISANSGLITTNQYAGWNFDGRAGITTIGTAVAPSGTTLPSGDTEAAFVEDSSWISQVVDVASSGTYTLQFQAARAQSASEELQLYVDGQFQSVSYNGTNTTPTSPIPTSFSFLTASASLTLSPGLHTIQILGVGSPNGDDTYGAALVTNVNFIGSGSPTLSDGSFQALGLSAGTYRYNPAMYAITATANSGPSVSGTGGSVAGQIVSMSVQQGLQGTPIAQESWAYFDYTGGGTPLFPTASDTIYGQTASADPRTTTYGYTFVSGSDLLYSETVIAPPITTSQNGPAASITDTANADTNTYVLDSFGNLQWTKDGDGFLTYSGYDPLTGGLLSYIQDVNTSDNERLLQSPQRLDHAIRRRPGTQDDLPGRRPRPPHADHRPQWQPDVHGVHRWPRRRRGRVRQRGPGLSRLAPDRDHRHVHHHRTGPSHPRVPPGPGRCLGRADCLRGEPHLHRPG